MRRTILFTAIAIATACGGGSGRTAADSTAHKDTLNKHQRDSVLGQSQLPGAHGVAGALRVQDSGAAHQRVVDSVANNP